MTRQCCGDCRLYSENMYRHSRVWKDARACVADVAHEMPASWSTNNRMDATAGSDCPLWEHAQAIEARRAETGTGSVHESVVDVVDASDPLRNPPDKTPLVREVLE